MTIDDLKKIFKAEMIDLGQFNPNYSEIFIPATDINEVKVGVTDQFLADAQSYSNKYFFPEHFNNLISKALTIANFSLSEPLILDIGSGSGNSVIPLLHMFPKSKIITTDISEKLLLILKKYLENTPQNSNRVITACIDVTKSNYLQENIFNLAVGASILHHLIDPIKCLTTTYDCLNEGGCAIFFEPFENGYSVLKLAYNEILDKASNFKYSQNYLNSDYKDFLQRMVRDYSIRSDPDKTKDIFRHMDDKWLFTNRYFENAKLNLGFSKLLIYPLYPVDHVFRIVTTNNMKVVLGSSADKFPAWAWQIIDKYDNDIFSPLMKEELLLDAAVILFK